MLALSLVISLYALGFQHSDFQPTKEQFRKTLKYGYSVDENAGMFYVLSAPSLNMNPPNVPKGKYGIIKHFDDLPDWNWLNITTETPEFLIFLHSRSENIPMRFLTYKYTDPQRQNVITFKMVAMSLNHVRFQSDDSPELYTNLGDLLLDKGDKTLEIAYEGSPLQLKYKFEKDNYYFDLGTTLAFGIPGDLKNGAPKSIQNKDSKGKPYEKIFIYYTANKINGNFKDSFVRIDKNNKPYYKNFEGINGWGQKESIATIAKNQLQ